MSYPIDTPACPHCHKTLSKVPVRSAKCPECKNQFFVKTISASKAKVLVTEKEREEIDKRNAEHAYRERWVRDLEQVGVPEKEFQQEFQSLAKEKGANPETKEVIQIILKKQADSRRGSNDFRGLRTLLFTIQRFLEEEEKDIKPIIIERMRLSLNEQYHAFHEINPKMLFRFEEETNPCGYCSQFIGNHYDYENAFELIPLLVNNCEFSNRNCECRLELSTDSITKKQNAAMGCAMFFFAILGTPILIYFL